MHMLYYLSFSLELHRWDYKLNVLVHKTFNANFFSEEFPLLIKNLQFSQTEQSDNQSQFYN